MSKIIGVIPARGQSTRFPGKPLAPIFGKPMIYHVYQSALKYSHWSDLYVATDDEIIDAACSSMNIPCIMTSPKHGDCIDRAAEVATILDKKGKGADKYIIIQGDEPLFDASILDADMSPSVVGFYTKVTKEEEMQNPNVVKVIVSKNLRAVYFSRYRIPYDEDRTRKRSDPLNVDKQIGVYALSSEALRQFTTLGVSYLEGVEGIGMLRFIENDIDVHMRYAQYDSMGVDVPEDIERVEKILRDLGQAPE